MIFIDIISYLLFLSFFVYVPVAFISHFGSDFLFDSWYTSKMLQSHFGIIFKTIESIIYYISLIKGVLLLHLTKLFPTQKIIQ